MRSTSRLVPLPALLFALALLVSPATPVRSLHAQARHRNVLILVGDDHGRDLGCYGAPVRTPHLDSLAREGTRFDYAFCTVSSCSPSRSVIMSGLHTHANGMYGLQHAVHKQSSLDSVRGLPNLLRTAGYRSLCVGKYHVAPEASYRFDEYSNEGGGRNGARMAQAAAAWLGKDPERPFLLYMGFTDPHRGARGFANEGDYPGMTRDRYDPARVTPPPFLPDHPDTRGDLADYYESVGRLDQGVGHVLRVLRDSGHLDDTLILYLSDNGIPFPGAKTTFYEPGMRLPLIVRAPAQQRRGVVSRAMVSWTDVLPTVLAYTGTAGPAYPLPGRSFLGVLDQDNPAGWDVVYGSHQFHEITMYYPMRVIRTRRHKYILNLAHGLPAPFASDLYNSATWQGVLRRKDTRVGQRTLDAFLHRPRHELYDLKQDPGETRNLASDPLLKPVLTDLQTRLRTWQDQTKDPWLVKYTHE